MDKRAFEEEMKEVATMGACLEHYEERRSGNKTINNDFRDRAFNLIKIAYYWLPEDIDLTKITIMGNSENYANIG